ncbi:MAG: DNA cytosine methyltransferase [Oligoflexus sp.]
MPKQQPTVLDLFCGAGGLSLGFHYAGFQTKVAIDHDSDAIESVEANFSHTGTIALLENLAEFPPSSLKSLLSENSGEEIDVIIGGPPCQGWSKVGRGKLRNLTEASGRKYTGRDPRNKMFHVFMDYVREFRPKAALMENVPGMLSHNGKNVAESVAHELRAAGYVVSWQLLNAVNFGVPQMRERLIFVGIRDDLRTSFTFPAYKDIRPQIVTVKEAIGDLPPIRNGSLEWIRDYRPRRELSSYAKRMREGADPATVFDHVCRNYPQDLEAFKLLKQGGWYRDLPERLQRYRTDIFQDKYKKLYWNKPSWCVTAHLSKDCYTHIHPSQARTISIREAARLQSFPDCFYLAGNMGTKFRLIGNAVPPLMAEGIARELYKQVFSSRRTHSKGSANRKSEVVL